MQITMQGNALRGLAQSGCLRACFPRRHGGPLEAVIVNTAGGIADGDRLQIDVAAAGSADMVVTTPSAERIYRARPGAPPARMSIVLRIANGARLAFLPQETIVFNQAAMERTLDVSMEAQGVYLGVEALIFGRQESAESITNIRLRDTIRLRRGGRLVLQDCVRLRGEVAPILTAPAGGNGARAIATLVYAATDSMARLDAVRVALEGAPAETGASAWDGVLVTRILAQDALALHHCVSRALSILHWAGLPRVWVS